MGLSGTYIRQTQIQIDGKHHKELFKILQRNRTNSNHHMPTYGIQPSQLLHTRTIHQIPTKLQRYHIPSSSQKKPVSKGIVQDKLLFMDIYIPTQIHRKSIVCTKKKTTASPFTWSELGASEIWTPILADVKQNSPLWNSLHHPLSLLLFIQFCSIFHSLRLEKQRTTPEHLLDSLGRSIAPKRATNWSSSSTFNS